MLTIDLLNKTFIPYIIGIFVVSASLFVFLDYVGSLHVHADQMLETSNVKHFETEELRQLIGMDKKAYLENDVIRMKLGDEQELKSLVDVRRYDGSKINENQLLFLTDLTNEVGYHLIYIKVVDENGYVSILKMIVILEGEST